MNTSAILSKLTKAIDFVYAKFTTNHFLMSSGDYATPVPTTEAPIESRTPLTDYAMDAALKAGYTIKNVGPEPTPIEDMMGLPGPSVSVVKPANVQFRSMLSYAEDILRENNGVWVGDVKSLFQEIAKRGYKSRGKTPHYTLNSNLFYTAKGRARFRKLDGVIYLV